MKIRNWKTKALIAVAASAFAVAPLLSQTAKPPAPVESAAATPTTAPTLAKISPDAKAVIQKMGVAYAKLTSLDASGKLSGDFDVAGRQEKQDADFTSSFASPNKFKHEIKNQAVVGSTGSQLYAFDTARNVYLTADAPAKKVMSDSMPDPFAQLVATQNISLMLALSKDPAGELSHAYSAIDKSPDVKEGAETYTSLTCTGREKGSPLTTLLIDKKTDLVRKAVINVAPVLLAQGAPDVKKALVTIDYTKTTPDAPTKAQQFAWAPPPGARDAKQMQAADAGGDATALEGKPAPAFKLSGLDGKEVSLASLKGKVVVLDFWATWCGPCVASLPKLDKLYQDKKAQGVEIFAVNQAEDKPKVEQFMKQKNLSVPVLLDSDSKVGSTYLANAIPETVVIGKDQKVQKVFVGAGPDTEQQLRSAVEAAQKSTP